MNTMLKLLEENLTQEEFTGYLKGRIVLNALFINSPDGGDNTATIKSCIEMLEARGRKNSDKDKPDKSGERLSDIIKSDSAVNNPGKARGKAFTKIPIDIERAKELYITQNLSLAKCSEILGVSESTLGREFNRHGIKKYLPTKQSAENTEASPDDEFYLNAARNIMGK